MKRRCRNRFVSIAFMVLMFSLTVQQPVLAQEGATRTEVVAMCRAAAEMVLQDRDGAIAEIGNSEGRFVWKDTYVFLMDMDGRMLAHPMVPQLTEKGSLLDVTDKDREKPKYIFREFVDIARKNGDGWIWYKWPKPNSREPVDKFTYIHRVGFTDMLVGAGIYK